MDVVVAVATLEHDIESTLGCAIFPIVYFAMLALEVHLTVLHATESPRGRSQGAYWVEVTVLATLIASLAHVLALGWVRERSPSMSLRMFVLLQIIVALLSAGIFFLAGDWLLGAAVWFGPAVITLGVYGLSFRHRRLQGR